MRNGRPDGAVRVTQNVAAVQSATRDAILGLALVGLLVLALGCLAGLVIARSVARPLHRLDAAARRIAGGDLEARAVVEGSREQRSLARSFNDMTARLARLVRSQRQFVADASHQLRTPLTAVRLRLEEARSESHDRLLADDLDAALGEVDRLARIVDELLVLSRAGERDQAGERVDVGASLRRAVERWEPAAAAGGIAVKVETRRRRVRPGWPAATSTVSSMRWSRTRFGTRRRARRSIDLAAGPGWLEVRDRGVGLEPGEEESVFERFHRGRAGRAGPAGTGLGLPIARELCASWGGSVRLTARPGGGAIARVDLPVSVIRARAGAGVTPVRRRSGAARAGARRRDHGGRTPARQPADRAAVPAHLRRAPARTRAARPAASGREAPAAHHDGAGGHRHDAPTDGPRGPTGELWRWRRRRGRLITVP